MNTSPIPLESDDSYSKRPIQFTGWWKATIISIFIVGVANLMLQFVEVQALNQIYARQKVIMDTYASSIATSIVAEHPKNKAEPYQIKNKIAETKADILNDMRKAENKASGVKPDVKN